MEFGRVGVLGAGNIGTGVVTEGGTIPNSDWMFCSELKATY